MQQQYPGGQFMEPWKQQNEFSQGGLQGLLTIERGNLLGIALGVILSATVGGFIASFINLGGITIIVAGVILRHFLKAGFGRDFANGVLIGGFVSLFSGLGTSIGAGLGGGIFSPQTTVAEPRTGQGGVSGTQLVSGSRRVVS